MSSFALRAGMLMRGQAEEPPPELVVTPVTAPPGTYSQAFARLNTGQTLYSGPAADAQTQEVNSIRKLIICMLIHDLKSAVFDVKNIQFLGSDDDWLSPWITNLPNGAMLSWRDVCAAMLVPSATDTAQTASRIIGAELRAIDGLGADADERFTIALNAKLDELGDTVSVIYGATPYLAQPNPSATSTPRAITNWLQEVYENYPDLVAEMMLAERTITPAGDSGYVFANENTLIDGIGENRAGIAWGGAKIGKTGDNGSIKSFAFSWEAPSGHVVYASQHSSDGNDYRFFDASSMLLHVEDDHPFLSVGRSPVDPHFANVVFCVGNTPTMVDQSSYAHPLTFGGGLTGIARPGKGFAYEYDFNGSRYARAADHAAFELGAEDFTIELLMRGKGGVTGIKNLLSKYKPTGTSRSYQLRQNGNYIEFWYSFAGSDSADFNFSVSPSATFWNGARRHVAVQRSGSTLGMYLNGQRVATTSVGTSAFHNSSMPLVLGAPGDPLNYSESQYGSFKLDAARITKGVCRYNFGGFSPIGAPYPTS